MNIFSNKKINRRIDKRSIFERMEFYHWKFLFANASNCKKYYTTHSVTRFVPSRIIHHLLSISWQKFSTKNSRKIGKIIYQDAISSFLENFQFHLLFLFPSFFLSFSFFLRYAWFMSTLGFASIGNLTVMAVERWLLVARPMQALSIR